MTRANELFDVSFDETKNESVLTSQETGEVVATVKFENPTTTRFVSVRIMNCVNLHETMIVSYETIVREIQELRAENKKLRSDLEYAKAELND